MFLLTGKQILLLTLLWLSLSFFVARSKLEPPFHNILIFWFAQCGYFLVFQFLLLQNIFPLKLRTRKCLPNFVSLQFIIIINECECLLKGCAFSKIIFDGLGFSDGFIYQPSQRLSQVSFHEKNNVLNVIYVELQSKYALIMFDKESAEKCVFLQKHERSWQDKRGSIGINKQ